MVQVNPAVPLLSAGSLAVMTTLKGPATLGVPVIRPDVALMLSPVGRPVALKVTARPSGSDALIVMSTGTPTDPVRLPGLTTFGGEFTDVRVACRHCMPK